MKTVKDVIEAAKRYEKQGQIDKAVKFYQAIVDRMCGTEEADFAQKQINKLRAYNDKFFHYEFKVSMLPKCVFDNDGFYIGKKHYLYSFIADVKLFSKPTALTNGVIQIFLLNGKMLQVAFSKKDKDAGFAIYDYLDEYVEKKGTRTAKKRKEAEEKEKKEKQKAEKADAKLRQKERAAERKNAIKSGDVSLDNFEKLNKENKAIRLLDYCKAKGYGEGFNDRWGIKHFAIIVDNLMPNEKVIFPFIGLHNYKKNSEHDGNFAYLVTNKRILCGQKKVVGQVFQSINWNNINDITFSTGLMFGVLTIDTYKETFNVGLDKYSATRINNKIHEVLEDIKNASLINEKPNLNQNQKSEISPYEELKKLKELLDMNIITQEEFDAKKKQLLNL